MADNLNQETLDFMKTLGLGADGPGKAPTPNKVRKEKKEKVEGEATKRVEHKGVAQKAREASSKSPDVKRKVTKDTGAKANKGKDARDAQKDKAADNKKGLNKAGQSAGNSKSNSGASSNNSSKKAPVELVAEYTFKLKEGEQWYDLPDAKRETDTQPSSSSITSLAEAMAQGQKLFDRMNVAYQRREKLEGSADKKWIEDIISSGTASDRIAGLTMMVQQEPLHTLSYLDNLVSLSLKKEQRLALMAMEALKDLLVTNLLPDRHLRRFSAFKSNKVVLTDKQALLLWFENELAQRVERFVDSLERGMHDSIEYHKKKCMEVAVAMMTDKPEQEARLLTLLVNKIGDPAGGVTTKAIDLLLNLSRAHPAMKGIVLREIKHYLHRSKLKPRAIYSGVICLCKMPLTHKDAAVAVDMVDTLASLFEKAVSEEEGAGRLLSALLNGINRAFPFIKDTSALAKHVDALFRIAHSSSFASSTQSLLLISQIVLAGNRQGKVPKSSGVAKTDKEALQESMVNRFYRALYAQLLTDQLSARAQSTLFLNLLFRSLKVDTSTTRVLAFVKRLNVRATQCAPAIAAGILMLVSELCKSRPELAGVLFEGAKGATKPRDAGRKDKSSDPTVYGTLDDIDLLAREPIYACPEESITLWEATLFQRHFHPSVRAFQQALSKEPHRIDFSGDPTVEFKLSNCINRFAYKNPKKDGDKRKGKRGDSEAAKEQPLNESAFMTQDKVEPDLSFFHKFFGEQAQLRKQKRRKASRRGDDDEESDGDSEKSVDGDLDFEADEDEVDRFADKLARDMMAATAGSMGAGAGDVDVDLDDPDLDDMSDDMGSEDEDEGSDVGEGAAFDGDEEDTGEGVEENSDDDGDDGFEALMGGADDSDEDDSEDEAPKKSKSKKRKGDDDDVFASIDDFEDTITANLEHAAKPDEEEKKGAPRRSVRGKMSKR
jgi:ribosome biogenesis protein MAK21